MKAVGQPKLPKDIRTIETGKNLPFALTILKLH
jgi:hypothetical protein